MVANIPWIWDPEIGHFIFFQVMTQRHNRQMSIAVYISVLAVTDNITLLGGKGNSEIKSSIWKGIFTVQQRATRCETLQLLFTSVLFQDGWQPGTVSWSGPSTEPPCIMYGTINSCIHIKPVGCVSHIGHDIWSFLWYDKAPQSFFS